MTPAASVPPEVAPVRPGEELDWPALEAYLRSVVEGLDGAMEVLQFPNGSANLTYLVRFGDRALVVRRPPFGQLAPGAHDMRREFRALSRLWQWYDRAPRAFAFCDDHAVVGSDFVVMEYRSGEVVWGAVPPSMAHHDDAARRIGFAVVDALADLHLVDAAGTGLVDLGRPDGFVARQVSGWKKRWELAAPPEPETLMYEIGDRLERSVPQSPLVSVLHNDFKVDNCQFDPADPDRVRSVFDWDMATVGDPLVDVGTLLNYWPDPSDTGDDRPMLVPGIETMGLPARAEVVERYAARTGFDVGDAGWYEAFGCWRTGVIFQQLHTRYLRGETTDERMADRGEPVGRQARRAAAILDRAGL